MKDSVTLFKHCSRQRNSALEIGGRRERSPSAVDTATGGNPARSETISTSESDRMHSDAFPDHRILSLKFKRKKRKKRTHIDLQWRISIRNSTTVSGARCIAWSNPYI